jgi:hypothetical protein
MSDAPNVTLMPMPTRTWYEVHRDHQTLYVRRGFVLIECNGEAHQPGNLDVDGCSLCAPFWGWRAVRG